MTVSHAVSAITNGMNVFVHGAAATPTPLIEAIAAREDLHDVRFYHLHTSGPAPFADEATAVATARSPCLRDRRFARQ